MTPTRRTALAGGLGVLVTAAAGVGGVESGLLLGRSRLPAGVPTANPGRFISGSFSSAARHGRSTAWSLAYPPEHLAGRLGPRRTAVAIAESPAVWHVAGQTAAGAFDDAADFHEHAIFGRLDLLAGIPLRLDCGDADGFAAVARDLRMALPVTPAGGIGPGGHDAGYWRSQAPAQLRFAASHLSR